VPQDLLDHLALRRVDEGDIKPPLFGAAGHELASIGHIARGIEAFVPGAL